MLKDRKVFAIQEKMQWMRLSSIYHITEAISGDALGLAKEENKAWIRFLRLFVSKLILPNRVNVYGDESQMPNFYMQKGFTFFHRDVDFFDGDGTYLGKMKQKWLKFSREFTVHNAKGDEIASIHGDWKARNFNMTSHRGQPIGSITKKWGGAGQEFFSPANHYWIEIAEQQQIDEKLKKLMVSVGLAIQGIFRD